MHTLSDVDVEDRTATCATCGPVEIVWRNCRTRPGWWQCRVARRKARGRQMSASQREYGRHKGDHCEKCGLVPVHRSMLEVDHIDGRLMADPHDPSNLQTLCANCHRFKTFAPDLFAAWQPPP